MPEIGGDYGSPYIHTIQSTEHGKFSCYVIISIDIRDMFVHMTPVDECQCIVTWHEQMQYQGFGQDLF